MARNAHSESTIYFTVHVYYDLLAHVGLNFGKQNNEINMTSHKNNFTSSQFPTSFLVISAVKLFQHTYGIFLPSIILDVKLSKNFGTRKSAEPKDPCIRFFLNKPSRKCAPWKFGVGFYATLIFGLVVLLWKKFHSPELTRLGIIDTMLIVGALDSSTFVFWMGSIFLSSPELVDTINCFLSNGLQFSKHSKISPAIKLG